MGAGEVGPVRAETKINQGDPGMNAHEHYEKAEQLIDLAEELTSKPESVADRLTGGVVRVDGLIAAAQVHATLALAASRHEVTIEQTTLPTGVPGLEKVTGVTRTERVTR